MEERLAELKNAIFKADVAALDSLLSAIDTIPLATLLDHKKYNYEEIISFAVRVGIREYTARMVIRSNNHIDLPYKAYMWLKVFDLASAPHASSTQIIQRLKFAKELIREDFPLLAIGHKPKYLKAAFSLGTVCKDALALGTVIWKSQVQTNDKINLLHWLEDNNYVTKRTLTYEEILYLVKGSRGFREQFQNHFNWILDPDESTGDTILHYSTSTNGVSVSAFAHIWAILKKKYDKQTVIAAASKRNHANIIPAIAWLPKYFENPSNYPSEFIDALKITVEQEDSNIIWQQFSENVIKYSQNMLLGFYLLQHGPAQNTEFLRNSLHKFTLCQDLTSLLHFLDKPDKSEKESESANIDITVNGNTGHFNLTGLPRDLFREILLYLAPCDLKRLYSCSKILHKEFNTTLFESDERIWHCYYVNHFKNIEEIKLPYRTRVHRMLEASSNWRRNKYSVVAELTGKPRLMNGDWLVMTPTQICKRASFWNCHTQQLSQKIKTTISFNGVAAILKDSYDTQTQLPKLLVSGYDGQEFLKVLSGNESYSLKNIPEHSVNKVVQIDKNTILFPFGGSIYDIEKETVTALGMPHFNDNKIIAFNPFNNTVVTTVTRGKIHYEISDLRTNKTVQILQPRSQAINLTYTRIIDEYTMFISGCDRIHNSSRINLSHSCGFVDLRTGSETIFSNLNEFSVDTIPSSNERLFLRSHSAPVIASWHLPSRKIEWLELNKLEPKMGNSQYMVLVDADTAYIRDYLSLKEIDAYVRDC